MRWTAFCKIMQHSCAGHVARCLLEMLTPIRRALNSSMLQHLRHSFKRQVVKGSSQLISVAARHAFSGRLKEAKNEWQAPLPAQRLRQHTQGQISCSVKSWSVKSSIFHLSRCLAAKELEKLPRLFSPIQCCLTSHRRWPCRRLSVLTALTALRFGIVSHVSGDGLVDGLAGSAATLQVRTCPGLQAHSHRAPRCRGCAECAPSNAPGCRVSARLCYATFYWVSAP